MPLVDEFNFETSSKFLESRRRVAEHGRSMTVLSCLIFPGQGCRIKHSMASGWNSRVGVW